MTTQEHYTRMGLSLFGVAGTWAMAVTEWLTRHGLNDITAWAAVGSFGVTVFCAIPQILKSASTIRDHFRGEAKPRNESPRNGKGR